MLKHMVLLQEKCIKCKIFKSFTRFNDFKDENKMLVVKLKKQHFKFIKLKRRISSFIRSIPVCLMFASIFSNVSVNYRIG